MIASRWRRFGYARARALVAVPLLLAAVSCSSESDDGAGTSSAPASTLPPGCEDDFRAFILKMHEAKACSDASECTHSGGPVPIFEYCSVGYYVNANSPLMQTLDGGTWELRKLETDLAQCFEPFGAGCTGPIPPAQCWRGKCWIDEPGLPATSESCFALSDKSTCSECLCGNRALYTQACLQDTGCKALLSCARKHGHLGRYDFDTGGLPYPAAACGALYDSASEVTKAMFREMAYAASRVGCLAFCAD